jgi:hypothetical protein
MKEGYRLQPRTIDQVDVDRGRRGSRTGLLEWDDFLNSQSVNSLNAGEPRIFYFRDILVKLVVQQTSLSRFIISFNMTQILLYAPLFYCMCGSQQSISSAS